MSEPGDQQSETPSTTSQSNISAVDASALLRFIEEQEVKASAKAENVAREADRRQIETLTAIQKQSNLGLWIAGIVAFCTIGQWITTVLNNAGTSDQTKKIIAASNINARAAQRSADAAHDFADTSGDIHDSLDEAVGKLDAQVRATEESAKLTRHVIEGSEAAVISPYAAPLNIPNAASLLYGIIVNFSNTGKVNAVHFASRASLERETLPDYALIGEPIYSNIHRDQIIPSVQRQGMGADQVAVSTFDTHAFSPNDIAQVKSMKETFKIEDAYSYGNGFGETIRGKICLLYVSLHNPEGSSSEGWISCEEARSDVSATLRRQQAAKQGQYLSYPVIPSASTITLPDRPHP